MCVLSLLRLVYSHNLPGWEAENNGLIAHGESTIPEAKLVVAAPTIIKVDEVGDLNRPWVGYANILLRPGMFTICFVNCLCLSNMRVAKVPYAVVDQEAMNLFLINLQTEVIV